jgi:hypothetical protein
MGMNVCNRVSRFLKNWVDRICFETVTWWKCERMRFGATWRISPSRTQILEEEAGKFTGGVFRGVYLA